MIFDGLSLRTAVTDQLLNPQQWLLNWLGLNSKSETGLNINDGNVLNSVPFFSVVNKLGMIMASLPINIYKTEIDPELGEMNNVDKSHYLYNILHYEPSPEIDKFRFMFIMEVSLNVYQNFYAQIIRDNAGRVIMLNPLQAWTTWPERNPLTQQIEYHTLSDGKEYILRKDQILHIVGFTKNGLVGIPIYELVKEAFGFDLALSSFGNQFFGNGVFPGIVIETPVGKAVADKTLEENLSDRRGGIKRGQTHKPLYLNEGQIIKFMETLNPTDAQALESREFSANQIAAIAGVPPHFVNYLKDATFSNVTQLGTELVQFCLSPKCVRYELAIRQQLFNAFDKEDHYVKIELGGLLRGDALTRNTIAHQELIDGRRLINEWRRLEDLNPIQGGDEPLIQYNVGGLKSILEISRKKAAQGNKNNNKNNQNNNQGEQNGAGI